MNEYIGKLDQSKHPLGKGWWRIKNPCSVHMIQDGQTVNRVLSRIWGFAKLYRKFVDIYCPPDSLMEIRVLNKDGEIYKVYNAELNRMSLDRIQAPTDIDMAKILPKGMPKPGRN